VPVEAAYVHHSKVGRSGASVLLRLYMRPGRWTMEADLALVERRPSWETVRKNVRCKRPLLNGPGFCESMGRSLRIDQAFARALLLPSTALRWKKLNAGEDSKRGRGFHFEDG